MGVSITRIVKFIRKGEKGSGLITAVTYLRKYTLAEWKNYGAVGKQNNWTNISNASDMNVGDTIVINGVVTDKENISISLYATIIAITGTTVIANSTTLIMAGERGIQGLQGLQGPRGEQGIPGTGGKNGETSYFHIKYSAVANPTVSSQMSETPNTYIGTYVDFTEADSTDPKKYTWHRFEGLQGPKGEQGIPGVGKDGKTTYLHIKYSNDGGKTFTANNGETVGDYIGFCTDFSETDPTSVSSYTWSKIKGEPGKDGSKGDRGPALRGPQAWSDCAVGYVFQSGASGEEYKDIVLYGNNYYSCIKSHAKTASNFPGSATDTNSGLWKLADKLEIVATKILLAQYALVKNLGVETIDMKDDKGNIIFPAKDGNVTCNSGTFKNITVKGNSSFEGSVKANMFYGAVKKVTPGSTYQIDPVNEPYNFYYVENPTKRTFIVLPKASNYEGLEINIFTKLSSSSSLSYRTIVKAQTNDDLYVKQNAAIVSSNIAVEKINVEYTNFKNDSITTQSNSYIRFKCIGGAWYAISGQFTGE